MIILFGKLNHGLHFMTPAEDVSDGQHAEQRVIARVQGNPLQTLLDAAHASCSITVRARVNFYKSPVVVGVTCVSNAEASICSEAAAVRVVQKDRRVWEFLCSEGNFLRITKNKITEAGNLALREQGGDVKRRHSILN